MQEQRRQSREREGEIFLRGDSFWENLILTSWPNRTEALRRSKRELKYTNAQRSWVL